MLCCCVSGLENEICLQNLMKVVVISINFDKNTNETTWEKPDDL